ncbi:MAG: aminoglycoside adenylyltransferase [Deltaproteobacteria bacterium]|jgi:lincosamide nucleotidyltransferase A/C/D/E|nr:aminoglycoside adenylyltransferase [Deltaproteobacteria bacterium]MBQ6669334.1 aminoglycoside adenylyltransferase [Deltaproteobacteria bacterium]MCR5219713.1 aminoglycoside adenylyltransferase [bacterium]
MGSKTSVTLNDLLRVLDLLDNTGIVYWLDGGWGVDALAGRQTREHRDVDIDFDARAIDALLQVLAQSGYTVETDQRPCRIELYSGTLGYIDIHPFVLLEDGGAKQAKPEGGWWEFPAHYFGETVFEGRRLRCVSPAGQRAFHSGYELRAVDRHDLALLENL